MEKDEYVQRYASAYKMPVAEVLKHLVAVRCDCDDPQCVGWAMTNVGDVAILSLQDARRYVLALRRVLGSSRAKSVGIVDGALLHELLMQLEIQASPAEGATVVRVDGGDEPVPEAVLLDPTRNVELP